VPIVVVLALVAGYLLDRLTVAALSRLARRTAASWDDAVVARLGGPLTLGWAMAVLYGVLPFLVLAAPAAALAWRALRVSLFAVFFWTLWRLVTIGGQVVGTSRWARAYPASGALVPLAARASKVIVVAMAIIAVLAELGYPVASLVAGLGIGGLALALAAQKTVENLFGAFSIGIDQPLREGDFVKVDDFSGTVEVIGLRSTRFRTLDRTIISIPNGKLADMKVETFAPRDRIRFTCTVGLEYGATAAQVREVVAGLDRVLRAQPKIWPEVSVRLKGFGESSLDIEVVAWLTTTDGNEFTATRQDILLAFMEVVEKAGTAMAYPTRTVVMRGGERAGARAD
jgi:MscS family membrane protein